MSDHVDPQAPSALDCGLHVRDGAASLRFYRDVIGCELDGELRLAGGRLWALRFGNSIIKLLEWDEAPVAANPSGVATGLRYLTFHVLDPDELVAACERGGHTVVRAPHDFSATVRNAIVLDPDGNIIEFCRGVAWERV